MNVLLVLLLLAAGGMAQPGPGAVPEGSAPTVEDAGAQGAAVDANVPAPPGTGQAKQKQDDQEEEATEQAMNRLYAALDQRMPAVLRGRFMGIMYWQYVAALLCLLLGLIVRKISDFVFLHTVLPAAKRTRFRFDHLVTEAVYKPLGVVFLLLGVFGAIAMLGLHTQGPGVRKFVVQALKVAFAVDLLWFVFRLVDVVAVYLSEMAERTESKLDDQLVPLIKKSLKAFVGILVFVAVVQNLGYNVGSLLAGLGIGGLAVAMAAKDTLANFFGGLVIFTDHPFRIGDWVKIGDVEGTVEQIGFRSTRVRTFPKTLVTIPNSQVADTAIDNKTAMPLRRVRTTVGVTYETKAAEMEALLEDFKGILRGGEGIDQELIVVRFLGFGASSLDILLQYFTKAVDYDGHLAVVEQVNLAVMRAVEGRGLSIAFPTRTVYFEGDVAKAMAGLPRQEQP
jgi:MscS family membrane protein